MKNKKTSPKRKEKKFPSMQGNSSLIVLLVILILAILVSIFFTYFPFWRMIFVSNGRSTPSEYPNIYAPSGSTENPAAKGNVDSALIGTWESDCLVPDLDSPWSEKHQFIINEDGSAQHTRWSSGDHFCSPQTTMEDKYKINTPGSGKIEFSTLEGVGPGEDIYQVTGNTLLFGHGFRNNTPYAENTLNQYIVYMKKQ